MKKLLFIALIAATVVTSCRSKSAIADTGATKATIGTKKNDDGLIAIDMASLKDEPAYLQAWEKFTDARIADDKKQKEDKFYEGHYTEYLDMYTALLKSTTAFSTTITNVSARVAFNEKVSGIQDKMYAK